MNTRESVWNPLYQKIVKITSWRKGWSICKSLQVDSDAPSNENFGCESSSGQSMREALKVASVAIEQGEEQKGCHSGSTQERRKSTLLH